MNLACPVQPSCSSSARVGSQAGPRVRVTANSRFDIPTLRSLDLKLETLNCKGDGIPAAEAEGGDAAPEVATLQFVEQRDEDARAACAYRMAEGYGSAVHVDFFRIEFELARDG